MKEFDGDKMREIEGLCREIGTLLKGAIEGSKREYGFALMVFRFDGPEFTYVSNAQRGDMVKAIREFLVRFEKGEANTTWAERN